MSTIQDVVFANLPSKRKTTPSGWTSFNAPCCQNRGERPDTRSRGGIKTVENQGWSYHCFNCGFKTSWQQGRLLSRNNRLLLKWLGCSDTTISELSLQALKLLNTDQTSEIINNRPKTTIDLPKNTRSLIEWSQDPDPQIQSQILNLIDYIVNQRGQMIDWFPWHWCPDTPYYDRLILPFYQNQTIQGYTARKISSGSPKYLTQSQPGYLFNIDRQHYNRKYCIIVEGPFDAIAIDAVAVLHNTISREQIDQINRQQKEIIVVPDRDAPGMKLIDQARENNWSVSLPNWELDIKDTADAVRRYGRLYTLFTILNSRTQNEIKIHRFRRQFENDQKL